MDEKDPLLPTGVHQEGASDDDEGGSGEYSSRKMVVHKKYALIGVIFALTTTTWFLLLLSSNNHHRHLKTKTTFAFDKYFPEDGSTWEFIVVDAEESSLATLEAVALEKLSMSPIFRCQDGLYGQRWIGKPLGSEHTLLLRLYKLSLQDTSPPNEEKFIVRHSLFNIKAPMSWRHDEFICSNPPNCTTWDSMGHVGSFIASRITSDGDPNETYKQKIELVPNSQGTATTCPLVKFAWWCLWIFCPSA